MWFYKDQKGQSSASAQHTADTEILRERAINVKGCLWVCEIKYEDDTSGFQP